MEPIDSGLMQYARRTRLLRRSQFFGGSLFACVISLLILVPFAAVAQTRPQPPPTPAPTVPAPTAPPASPPSSVPGPPSAVPPSSVPGPPSSSVPLSLDASVSYALAHNPQMRVAAAQREIALAKLIPERPKLRPDVEASAFESIEGPPLNLPLTVGPGEVVVPYQQHQIAVSAEQLLFHPGQSANGTRLAAQVKMADTAYADAVAGVAHDVMTAYYQVLQARAGEAVAQQAVTDLQGSVDRVKILIQAGQAVSLDLLTAQAALGQTQQDATVAANDLIVADANLNRTLGRPLMTPVTLAPPAAGLVVPATLADATHTALVTRPDIQQQEAQVQAARSALALARGENGPTVTAKASYALQTPTALQRSTEWMLRAMVSIPIFQSAAVQSDIQQAVAGVDAAEAGLQALQDADTLLVLQAWENLQTARSALTSDAAAASEQQEAYRATGIRLQAGEATQGDLAQARLKLEQAVSTQTRDQYAVDLRTIDLRYALGLLAPKVAAPAPAHTGVLPAGGAAPVPVTPVPTPAQPVPQAGGGVGP